MIPPLYDHQKKIIADPRMWFGIFTGTGSAKTRTGLELAEGRTLVIVPKQQREDKTWQDNASKFGIFKDITVISKEEFRRDWETLRRFDTVIVDECHHMLGVLPDTRQRNKILIPKTSQLFEGLSEYIKGLPPKRFYLLSATPATKPMHVYALGTLLGKRWDFISFREKYYTAVKMGAYRNIWIPKKDKALKERLVELIKELGYTGGLSDFFDVPPQTHIVKHFGLTEAQKGALKALKDEEADPMAVRAYTRAIENGVRYGAELIVSGAKSDRMQKKTFHYGSEKIEYILEKVAEFPKMLIFAAYIGQIDAICDALTKEGYPVTRVTGATKDRANVFKLADAAERAVVVVQAGISEGYELKSVPVVIYASLSNKVRDKVQGDGRVLRGDALKKNLYITLVVKGGLDEQCYNTITSGVDFNEKVMDNERIRIPNSVRPL